MSVNIDDPTRLNGTTVIGGDGEKLGYVDAVYYDNATDEPRWVAVRSGLFGIHVSLVPLTRADLADDALRVPFDRIVVRDAPHHDPDRDLSPEDEADLYRHYGIDTGDDAATTDPVDTDSARTEEMDLRPLRDGHTDLRDRRH